MQTGREKHRHGNRSNISVETQGNSTVISFEVESPSGQKVKIRNRTIAYPTLGRVMEYLEGPLAGSKAMTYYIPMGEKTGITVVGEFVSQMIPESEIRQFVLSQFEKSFEEDQENLKNFQ